MEIESAMQNKKTLNRKNIFICIVIIIAVATAVFIYCLLKNKNNNVAEQPIDKGYSDVTKITDYLYEITYNNYEDNFQLAQEYFEKQKPQLGGCSSVQNDYIRGRNYDWTYDDDAIFAIHTPATEERHASVGVASGLSGLTQTAIENGDDLSQYYAILPYATLDGINDAGVIINVNIVNFGEKGVFTMKTEDTSDDYFPSMVSRLVLDKANNVEKAISLLKDVDMYSIGTVEEAHFMISGPKSSEDNTYTTIVAEFIPDENQHYQLSIIGTEENPFVDNKPIMTNFHLTDFDGTVESLTKHPMGYERYQILSENFDQGTTVSGMSQLMKKVYYTNFYDLYSDRYWYSEDTKGDLTLDKAGETSLNGDLSRAGGFIDIATQNHENYENRQRDGKTWHTVHTSIFDGKNLTLSLIPQEGGYAYNFQL